MSEVFSYQDRAVSTQRKATSDVAVEFEIRLFGPMEVRVCGRPLPRLRSRKGLWLLALLTLRAGRDVERDWLAGTLWPDCREAAARRSLRQSLHDLRCALGPEAGRLSCESPRTLRLDLSPGAWADVTAFDATTASSPHSVHDPEVLEKAVQLYRGRLLEDCGEDWVIEERRQREHQYIASLEGLASLAVACSDHKTAANYLRLAVAVDPLREDLQRSLMNSLAVEGNLAAALLVFRQYRTRLWQEMATEPDAETAALYRRLQTEARKKAHIEGRGEPASLVPDPAFPVPSATPLLPRPRTELIGREADMEEVIARFAHTRLLTLTGTGGVGKTRLALLTAERTADDFKSGACFIDLAPLTDPASVPEAVRKMLDIPAEGEAARQPLIEVLCHHLASRRLLLVLDNCEQLLDACATMTDALLAACPGLRILATSRQALGLRGETVWRVPSLTVPPSDTHKEDHEKYAAVRLFAARARDVDSNFRLTPRNSAAVARVCRRLDGIPLAIELAAARVRVLTVEEIDARLGNQFRLLTGGDRAAMLRQQTLRGALDWSWNLLTRPEQSLLTRLSVFSGGWTLEAGEAVCVGGVVEEAEILDILTALVDKSLVVAEKRPNTATRYRLLETVRQYGWERLVECGEAEVCQVRTRHQAYFADFARTQANIVTQKRGMGWAWLETEEDNLRVALEWRGNESVQEAAARRGLDLAGTLGDFWVETLRLKEGGDRLRGTLDFADRVCTDKDETFRFARTKAVRYLASLVWEEGEHGMAQRLYEEALAEYRRLGDNVNTAAMLHELGVLFRFQGEYDRARSRIEESLSLNRAYGEPRTVAQSLAALGVICGDQGDLDQSLRYLRETLTIQKGLSNQSDIAKTLGNLGNALRERGEYVAARTLLEEGLAIHRVQGNQRSVVIALSNLGGCTCDMGDYPAAYSQLEEALTLSREAGNKEMVAVILTALGIVAGKQGEFLPARALLNEALEAHQTLGSPNMVAMTLQEIAVLDAAQGQLTRAMRLWGAAEAQREAIGAPLKIAERLEHEEQVAQARAALGEDASDATWTDGRSMSAEEACFFALH